MLLVAGLVATPVSAQGPPRFDLAAGRIFGGVTGVMAQIGICQRFALAKGEGGKEEAMSWMEVAIEYRKSVSGAIRRGVLQHPMGTPPWMHVVRKSAPRRRLIGA